MKTTNRENTKRRGVLACTTFLLGAGVSFAGCAQMKDRFDLFAPIAPEMDQAKLSKDGTYRDEYGVVHAYKDSAANDRPISESLSMPIPFGSK